MKFQNLSVKRLFGRVAMELVLSMSGITIARFLVTKQVAVLRTGGTLLLCALVGIFVLTQAFGKRLSQFTADLCQTLDHMIAGNEAPQRPEDSEPQLARIGHRLARLYQIMQENRRREDEERQELQTLVSDISHQVKTPVSNLKMATDTLLEKPMTEAERTDFIRGIRSQTDKLDFLFQALVKTSRLETGVIQLDKKPGRLFDTVAQAMSGIVYAAEKKEIAVSVDCPEDLTVSHDSKWTSEALFNLLDNAVKYTPAGGKIAVSVVLWEMYVEVKVTDTGKGISESNQAAYLDGTDVTEINEKQIARFRRENLGFVFQDFNLLDTLTISENIALALTINKVPAGEIDGRVREMAGKLNITDILDKYPYQVSGGQKQRCACARAIINQPKLILADEPTGALDSHSSQALLSTIQSINESLDATILMVTHDAFSASYANRILFLRDGAIFTEILKGSDSRRVFFEKILDVLTMMGGGVNDVR